MRLIRKNLSRNSSKKETMKVSKVKAKSHKIEEYESKKEVFVLDNRNGFNFVSLTAKSGSISQINTNNYSSGNFSGKMSQVTYD